MVGKTIVEAIVGEQSPVFLRRFGNTREAIFVTAEALKKEYGIDRNDIVALTRQAAEISGIAHVVEADSGEAEKILGERTVSATHRDARSAG
jgi:hypothetical protein